MPVPGHYIANMVRRSAMAYVRGYVTVFQNNVLPVFANLNDRVKKIEDDEYRRLCELPASENFSGDLSELADQSHEAGMVFYKTMTELRQATLALYAVGLFHSIEQNLRDICDDASFGVSPPRDTKLSVLVKWYRRNFKLDLTSLSSWSQIDTLQLLANAVKHGPGNSESQLRQRCPALFEDHELRDLLPDYPEVYTYPRTRLPLAGQGLCISESQFAEFGASAITFMEEVAVHFQNQSEHFFVDIKVAGVELNMA